LFRKARPVIVNTIDDSPRAAIVQHARPSNVIKLNIYFSRHYIQASPSNSLPSGRRLSKPDISNVQQWMPYEHRPLATDQMSVFSEASTSSHVIVVNKKVKVAWEGAAQRRHNMLHLRMPQSTLNEGDIDAATTSASSETYDSESYTSASSEDTVKLREEYNNNTNVRPTRVNSMETLQAKEVETKSKQSGEVTASTILSTNSVRWAPTLVTEHNPTNTPKQENKLTRTQSMTETTSLAKPNHNYRKPSTMKK
jgi:hypothetical protein